MDRISVITTGLRIVRKLSHVSKQGAQKTIHLLERVENKATRLIKSNAELVIDEGKSIPVDSYIYGQFPHIFPVHPALPTINQRPSITVFAFLDPKGFYGGIATLLITAGVLANKLGYDLRVAQTTGFSDKTDVLQFLASKGVDINPERFSTINLSERNANNFSYLPLHPDDIIVTSAWWDAHIAAQLPLKNKFIYLIQDYEPIFYNNGDSSVLADQTYFTEKFIPVCNTEILYNFFVENGYNYIAKNAFWFEPAPAPPVEAAFEENHGSKKLFLYGRPNVDRNLFYTALQALDMAFSSGRIKGKWELFAAGQGEIPNIKLSSGHIINNLGKMDIEEYYRFAANVDVAVSPMLAPHPNYPTLEFASLGAAVVSTKWKTKQNLSNYSNNIFMADATVASIADSIVTATSIDRETLDMNRALNTINSSWVEALDIPLNNVIKAMRKI